MSHPKTETLSGAQIVVRLLERQGIRCVARPGRRDFCRFTTLCRNRRKSRIFWPVTSREVVSWRKVWPGDRAGRRVHRNLRSGASTC